MTTWPIFQKTKEPHDGIEKLPPPPKWREFQGQVIEGEERHSIEEDPRTAKRLGDISRGRTFEASDEEIEIVNAALYLRRPLLVTGKPGIGKSSLAYSVAYQLKLGRVLHWPITTRSNLKDGLYHYDAVGRLQELQMLTLQEKFKKVPSDEPIQPPDIGQYIRLGPLGTAFLPSEHPRVLLIDEIDKSDIDLPNDLLNIFEEGEFEIPELKRLSQTIEKVRVSPHDARKARDKVTIVQGRVICKAFPFIVLTSNAERELPAPFLRRCLRLDIKKPDDKKLAKIVEAHFGDADKNEVEKRNNLIKLFFERREKGDLATDQLLNAVYLTTQGIDLKDKNTLIETVLKHLNSMGTV